MQFLEYGELDLIPIYEEPSRQVEASDATRNSRIRLQLPQLAHHTIARFRPPNISVLRIQIQNEKAPVDGHVLTG